MRQMFALATIAGLFALAACGADPEDASTSIQSKSAPAFSIRQAGNNPPVVNLEVTLAHAGRDARLMTDAAAAVRKVGKDMNAGHPPAEGQIDAINFTFLGPPSGDAAVGRKLLHASFDAQTLGQTVHMTDDSDAILAAAKEAAWWTPWNDDVVSAYCRGTPGSNFCGKFAAP